MYIHWEDSFKIGNPLIDAEHQMMVMLCKKLDYAIKANASKPELIRVVVEMKKFAEFHFVSEENLMIEIGYPGYDNHAKIHTALLRELDLVAAGINKHGQIDAQELLDYIWRWLATHIEKEDLKIADHLKLIGKHSLALAAFENIYPTSE